MEENLDVPFSIQTSVDSRILEWARETSHEFAKRISYYRCAMLDVENRFNVLNEEYLLDHGRPPINSVKTRLKTIPSIQEKVKRKGISFSIAEVENISLQNPTTLDKMFVQTVEWLSEYDFFYYEEHSTFVFVFENELTFLCNFVELFEQIIMQLIITVFSFL